MLSTAFEVIYLIKFIQEKQAEELVYYLFHVLGFLLVFLFNIWYGKKRRISALHSVITTLLVYSATYIWIYVLFWIESGFSSWGGNNIVRGFIYVPLLAYPVAKLLKIKWIDMCDFIAPCVCLSQGISHIGCIFTGCCGGYPSSWGIYSSWQSCTVFPVQLFESATALAVFALLVYLNKKQSYQTDGKSYPLMLILFGSTRFLWEFARDNEKILLGCSSLAFHALFMAIVGATVLYCIHKTTIHTKRKRKK